jgi:nucleoside-diphosphate-sugar epimerase
MSTTTKILITGSSGFVGSNLSAYLNQDFDLYGLDISKSEIIPVDKNFEWDKLNRLPEVDAIIHLAGKAHDTANIADDDEYFEINLGLTQIIFDHFLESTASKFIFFSSVKAVADTVDDQVLTEESALNPLTAYGKSKLAAEQYILSKTISANKSVYILRPCMIHGPGNKGNLNLLYKVVQKGIPWPLGAFENRRSFASISNVSYAVRRLIEEAIPAGIYQVADDEPLSTNELVSIIAESLGRKPKIWNLPKSLITSLAKAGDVLRLPLNSERLKKLTESYVVSNEKLKNALSTTNMPVSAKEGLINTLLSFS